MRNKVDINYYFNGGQEFVGFVLSKIVFDSEKNQFSIVDSLNETQIFAYTSASDPLELGKYKGTRPNMCNFSLIG